VTQEQLQEYWDACLIRHWRLFGTVLDAIYQWERLTNLRWSDTELLRKPKPKFPLKVGVRAFVAAFLPKINDWLWEHPKEKDIDLLKKLKGSKYTTAKNQINSQTKRDQNRLSKSTKKEMSKSNLDKHKWMERNRDTDWNITK
jgi:hypothetical protein